MGPVVSSDVATDFVNDVSFGASFAAFPMPVNVARHALMRFRRLWCVMLVVVLAACAAPKRDEPQMTPEQRRALLDAHALAAPPKVESDAGKLLDYLLKPARDDAEKSHVIARWVSDRFIYVIPGQETEPPRYMTLDELLVYRKSQCEGYASAYLGLAKKAGLKAIKIAGHAKGAPELLSGGDDRENHAWNFVQINGKWQGVDTTWAAGSVEGGRFTRRYNPYFLSMDPEQMLLTHFSFKDELGTQKPLALTFDEFLQLPAVNTGFASTGFSVKQIIAQTRGKKDVALVQTYDTANDAFKVVNAPIVHALPVKPQRFVLQSKIYEQMAIVEGQSFTYFSRQNETFDLEHTPAGNGALVIMGRKPGEREFEGLLGYDVR